ncbi:MAG: type II toxin-antitoxin system death-on-curing family toxin [Salinibacterium sp.]|nr:MAG: type II toxin-antitoxin system death-on-curing family toxin [Salinibacterium sp.]
MTRYLDPEDALAVVQRMGLYVRDEGLLFSALARPAASAFGADAYPTLELKAAALFSSLARNHALIDGNKRTSWVLTVAFLNINGYDIDMTQNEKFDLVLGVAQGQLELEEIAATLARHLVAEA